MYRVILVPLDGTDLSRHALPWALALARPARASLRLVHALVLPYLMADGAMGVVPWPAPADVAEEPARRELDGLAARLAAATGLDVAAAVEDGDPADAILRYAGAHGVDLIVMATHARGAVGRALLGSVAESLVHDASLPMLLVHPRRGPGGGAGRVPDETETATARHVLVPVDGSPAAEEILPHAGAVCAATGASCTLLHVSQPMLATGIAAPPALVDDAAQRENEAAAQAYLESVARRMHAGEGGVAVSTHVARGGAEATAAIVAFAAAHAVDFIAMATHHRRGLARALMGSTAGSLLHDTALPMLLVRVR